MLIESIVGFTLGIKDHRVVSIKFEDNELRISLDARKRRKLPYGLCGRRSYVKDKLKMRKWAHVSFVGHSRLPLLSTQEGQLPRTWD